MPSRRPYLAFSHWLERNAMSAIGKLRNVFRLVELNAEIDEELAFHLEQRTADLVADGIKPDEAARRARVQFGNPLVLREESHKTRAMAWLEDLWRNLRYGFRLLRKSPGFSLTAILSLGLAIGACTAAFSLLNAVIFRKLPVAQADRLFFPTFPISGVGAQEEADGFSYPMYVALKAATRREADLVLSGYAGPQGIQWGSEVEKVTGQYVSGDAFRVLGVGAELGRVFLPEDDAKPGANSVALLSYAYWESRFGKDPKILGRTFRLDKRTFQVIGVVRKGFNGVEPGNMIDFWMPATMYLPSEALANEGWTWFRILGRLKDGASLEQARQRMQPVFSDFMQRRVSRFSAGVPKSISESTLKTKLTLQPGATGRSGLRRGSQTALWVLGGIVGLVLLIACANVANLLLARGAARSRELALRVAIGAGKRRLIEQVLVEGALLTTGAAVLGLLFALWAGPAIVAMMGSSRDQLRLDLSLGLPGCVFFVVLCALATLFFGLAPALGAARTSPGDVLHSTDGGRTTRRLHSRVLVGVQVLVCTVVLFAACLFLRTFERLLNTNLGFRPENVTIAEIASDPLPRDPAGQIALWSQLKDRVSTIPGVESASLSSWTLMLGSGWSDLVRIPGQPVEGPEVQFLAVSPGFFHTMGMRLVAGRDVAWQDALPRPHAAAVVDEAFVRRYFPGQSPLGRRFEVTEGTGWSPPVEILGVVANGMYRDIRDGMHPTVFVPLDEGAEWSLELRTREGFEGVIPVLRREVSRVHPSLRVNEVYSQSEIVNGRLVRERTMAVLSMFFAGVALLLAAVGLYGVLNYNVVQRTREIGIRLALGSSRADVIRLIVRETVVVTTIALAAGLAVGYGLSRYVSSLLYEVKPSDASSFVGPAVGLLLFAFLAALAPAWRAACVQPMTALRYE
jgi:putative ABC transport system permease protein